MAVPSALCQLLDCVATPSPVQISTRGDGPRDWLELPLAFSPLSQCHPPFGHRTSSPRGRHTWSVQSVMCNPCLKEAKLRAMVLSHCLSLHLVKQCEFGQQEKEILHSVNASAFTETSESFYNLFFFSNVLNSFFTIFYFFFKFQCSFHDGVRESKALSATVVEALQFHALQN